MTDSNQDMDDIARLIAVLVRDSFETQTEAIQAMSKSGMTNGRIADLLGTSPNTVNVTLQKAKQK